MMINLHEIFNVQYMQSLIVKLNKMGVYLG